MAEAAYKNAHGFQIHVNQNGKRLANFKSFEDLAENAKIGFFSDAKGDVTFGSFKFQDIQNPNFSYDLKFDNPDQIVNMKLIDSKNIGFIISKKGILSVEHSKLFKRIYPIEVEATYDDGSVKKKYLNVIVKWSSQEQ